MATIKVNSKTMKSKAATFRSVRGSIESFVSEMKTEINGMRSVWEGSAADETIKKFETLAKNFDSIYATINSYATFLDEAAERYDQVETANEQGAQ